MLRSDQTNVLLLLLAMDTCVIAGAAAQGPILDVLDGETLYEGGSLLTFGNELSREEVLRTGGHRVADPLARHRFVWTSTAALQYGLRNDLQIGFALPYVAQESESTSGLTSASGVGDLELLAKWRFHRWDAPRVSINTSLIATLSLPTGDDDRHEHGVELEPELQTGAGGVDPALGLAITPEPGRWRFNAAVFYRFYTDTDGDGDRRGNALVGELAVGNRFWLEPYPGPFMRLDALLRFYHEDRDRSDHRELDDTGGDRLAVGANLAFRPRPALDFQIGTEIPVWHDVNGTQLDEDWSVQFNFGYRF